jgi:hypothetical protein
VLKAAAAQIETSQLKKLIYKAQKIDSKLS